MDCLPSAGTSKACRRTYSAGFRVEPKVRRTGFLVKSFTSRCIAPSMVAEKHKVWRSLGSVLGAELHLLTVEIVLETAGRGNHQPRTVANGHELLAFGQSAADQSRGRKLAAQSVVLRRDLHGE